MRDIFANTCKHDFKVPVKEPENRIIMRFLKFLKKA